jgi:hypothetical protein
MTLRATSRWPRPGPTVGTMGEGALVPIVILLVVLATDVWVYVDARAQAERGMPVVLSFGSLKVTTPAAWFVGCLLLWIVFLPLYITGRSH